MKEIENKEEKIRKKIILADIKENAWKRRGFKSSHEECVESIEKLKKNEEREKVKDRIKKMEEMQKNAEEREIERRRKFMVDWKENEDRKRKAETIQKGWKDLMDCVAKWEEIDEEEMNEENIDKWFSDSWTEEGVAEAGKVVEEILTEAIAFIELREIHDRTVQANN